MSLGLRARATVERTRAATDDDRAAPGLSVDLPDLGRSFRLGRRGLEALSSRYGRGARAAGGAEAPPRIDQDLVSGIR